MIVQRLRAIQDEYGFLPDAVLRDLAKETGTPLYRLQEVASFFPHFRQEWNPPPYVEVKVCRDMACHRNGAKALTAKLKALEAAGAKAVVVEGVSCLGRCDRAPALSISRYGHEDHFHDAVYAGRSPDDVERTVRSIIAGQTPPPDLDAGHAIDRSNWEIDVYAKDEFPKYDAVRQYLAAFPEPIVPPQAGADGKPLKPEDLEAFIESGHPWLKKLQQSGLIGMGGAGMPAYAKWSEVWKANPTDGSNEKYIVCNGDESEPSTFKDREILLHLPHLVVEGVILGGLLANATAGYIFIRHEYREQIESVRAEIERAMSLGACGENIFGTARSFSVEVYESPGGYICGEQSALIEAMEDKRAQPRNKPPELLTNGFRDRPTVVNNVETIAWTPSIMLRGGKWYATEWIKGYRGRRLFSICGDLARPGVFEVPIGTTLGQLIDLAGGLHDGRPLKAVALSGPSGGLIPARIPVAEGMDKRLARQLESARNKDHLQALVNDLLIDGRFFDVRKLPLDKGMLGTLGSIAGADFMLGAGIAIYADPCDVLDQAVRFTEFFRNESCGKCVPCRIGSQKLAEIGADLLAKRDRRERIALDVIRQDVLELNKTLSVTSICGLGQVAGSPLATALVYFADEVTGQK